MRAILRAALALCALCACECMFDSTPPGVRQLGEAPPPRTDEVIAAARSICGRDLRGNVTWVDQPLYCDGVQTSGCSSVGSCHLNATVWWAPEIAAMPTALQTALAHEIGHYCWETGDEARANEFAADVRGVLAPADDP